MSKIKIISIFFAFLLIGSGLYLVKINKLPLILNGEQKEEVTARLNQRILNNGVYITPLEVIDDSRCPIDVTCVWGGQLVVRVKLERNSKTQEFDLNLWSGVAVFEGKVIDLIEATPKGDYRFKFEVTLLPEQGTVEGRVSVSPTCPVETVPPKPECTPRPLATPIRIIEKKINPQIVKTIQSDSLGMFKTDLYSGPYELWALPEGTSNWPTCEKVAVLIEPNKTTTVDISCDSGIR